jgi:hypothetical protein
LYKYFISCYFSMGYIFLEFDTSEVYFPTKQPHS